MAKQIGTIKLKGKLGGISFYLLNGEPVARQAGGFTREAIKNSRGWIGSGIIIPSLGMPLQ